MCQFLRRAHGVNLLKNVVGVSLKITNHHNAIVMV